ncbi:MAG TPA: prenyltransferase/squalene oxidase repeat-containing protein [Bryobacteraceae bacterium]|nr:prenyltransferase/squalene oxidase repeat-containing protein [Bryobacteraceae bacterium]
MNACEQRIAPAIAAALNFLLKAQDERGAWKDFLLPAGASDIWVTGFTGLVVAGMPGQQARNAALAAWRFLENTTSEGGGWSYNATVPGDADSTLWGLRLARSLGLGNSPRAQSAIQFLDSHICADGGLTTYASADPIRRYIGLPPMVPFIGWTHSHVCVTAAGANIPGYRERLEEYLLRYQDDDGGWPAYWWFDREYSTSEAAAVLAGTEACERAVSWALRRAPAIAEPNAFALAHCLRILTGCATPAARESTEDSISRLLAWQRPDGSWAPSAKLRVPRPDSAVPAESPNWRMWSGMPPGQPSFQSVLQNTFNIYSPDHYGVYTTATVLRTLVEIEENRLYV